MSTQDQAAAHPLLTRIEPAAIDDENPWQDDLLDRKTLADKLTTVVTTIRQPFTLGITAGYGSGKSFFLRRLKSQLHKKGYATAYFSAWETDFTNDPLAAFMSTIEGQIVHGQKAKKTFAALAKSAAPLVAKGLLKKAIGDEAGEAILNVTGLSTEDLAKKLETLAEERLNAQKGAEKAVSDFRERLSELTSTIGTNHSGPKFVIFVDELDRCKPDYALAILEHIKHFFAVPGVLFIVGADRGSLGHFIGSLYGANFDANGYLRRFFDLWLELPEPDYDQFANALVKKFALVEDKLLKAGEDTKSGANDLANVFSMMAKSLRIPLREQEQIFTEINLALRTKHPKASPDALMLPVIATARHYVPDQCRRYCLGLDAPDKFAMWVHDTTREVRAKFPRLSAFVLGWGLTENSKAGHVELPAEILKDGQDIFQELQRQRGNYRGNVAQDIYANLEFWGAATRR